MNLVRISASALLIAATTACIGLSNASTANDQGDYRVITFKDCKKVGEITLNNEQIAAYLELKHEQVKLEALEQPISNIEQLENVQASKSSTANGTQRNQISELASQATTHYQRAVEAQRAGDWATYGNELERLGRILEELQSQ